MWALIEICLPSDELIEIKVGTGPHRCAWSPDTEVINLSVNYLQGFVPLINSSLFIERYLLLIAQENETLAMSLISLFDWNAQLSRTLVSFGRSHKFGRLWKARNKILEFQSGCKIRGSLSWKRTFDFIVTRGTYFQVMTNRAKITLHIYMIRYTGSLALGNVSIFTFIVAKWPIIQNILSMLFDDEIDTRKLH